MFFGFLGGGELFIVIAIILLLFGANRLPQLGDALGRGIRNFKDAITGKEEEENKIKTINSPEESSQPKSLPEGQKNEYTIEQKESQPAQK